MHRRTLIKTGLGVGALALGAPALAIALSSAAPGDTPDRTGPATATGRTGEGMAIHALRTGFVRVKAAHRDWAGPAALRLPAVLGDWRWSPWMPVLAFLIEHPEGPILVDTGESPRVMDPGYFACDPENEWFYRRNLAFDIRPGEAVDRLIADLGIDPATIRTVAMTHLHSDHMGGLEHFPRTRVLVSDTDWPGHRGMVRCLLPAGFAPDLVRPAGPGIGAFAAAMPLTRAGDVHLVPTPGHTPGHQSVLVDDRAAGRHWLIGGDACFDLAQARGGAMAGIVEDWGAARASLSVIARQIAGTPTILAPAHDPGSMARIAAAIPG